MILKSFTWCAVQSLWQFLAAQLYILFLALPFNERLNFFLLYCFQSSSKSRWKNLDAKILSYHPTTCNSSLGLSLIKSYLKKYKSLLEKQCCAEIWWYLCCDLLCRMQRRQKQHPLNNPPGNTAALLIQNPETAVQPTWLSVYVICLNQSFPSQC